MGYIKVIFKQKTIRYHEILIEKYLLEKDNYWVVGVS
jgi:hypothetical protein